MACVIEGLDTAVNKVSQVEVVIYMAGADSDCNDSGKTSSGSVKMFFDTANATAEKPTAVTVDATGKLTMTGTNGATVEYKVGNDGTATSLQGSWNTTTFTATNNLPDSAKGQDVYVRQSVAGKDPSEWVKATTNNFKA